MILFLLFFTAVGALSINIIWCAYHLQRLRLLQIQVDRLSNDMTKIWTKIFNSGEEEERAWIIFREKSQESHDKMQQVLARQDKLIDDMRQHNSEKIEMVKSAFDENLGRVLERLNEIERMYREGKKKRKSSEEDSENGDNAQIPT